MPALSESACSPRLKKIVSIPNLGNRNTALGYLHLLSITYSQTSNFVLFSRSSPIVLNLCYDVKCIRYRNRCQFVWDRRVPCPHRLTRAASTYSSRHIFLYQHLSAISMHNLEQHSCMSSSGCCPGAARYLREAGYLECPLASWSARDFGALTLHKHLLALSGAPDRYKGAAFRYVTAPLGIKRVRFVDICWFLTSFAANQQGVLQGCFSLSCDYFGSKLAWKFSSMTVSHAGYMPPKPSLRIRPVWMLARFGKPRVLIIPMASWLEVIDTSIKLQVWGLLLVSLFSDFWRFNVQLLPDGNFIRDDFPMARHFMQVSNSFGPFFPQHRFSFLIFSYIFRTYLALLF